MSELDRLPPVRLDEKKALDRLKRAVESGELRPQKGRVTAATGTVIRAVIPGVRHGELCHLEDPRDGSSQLAEVVGLVEETAILTPIGGMAGLSTRTEVVRTGSDHHVPVGPWLLGRVLDGLGRPIDGGRDERPAARYPVTAAPPHALTRALIDRPMPVGIRAIDGLLTCGEGQRVGIYGSPGLGKSHLMAAIAKRAAADVMVVALIGERGREVRDFLDRHLGPAGRARSVVVAATSDRPPMERVKAAYVATTIAEYFRDQGQRVLLLMDSVTRFARAQREIGLAAGEPPARRGFPPSVFAALPQLAERAGRTATGSITAFYSVLVEGDASSDPIAEETRGILDGHIVLSPKLANRGHFPAIDILESRSRVMDYVASEIHVQAATRVREWLARFADVELLIQVGEYKKGADPGTDKAVDMQQPITAFLRQAGHEAADMAQTVAMLQDLAV